MPARCKKFTIIGKSRDSGTLTAFFLQQVNARYHAPLRGSKIFGNGMAEIFESYALSVY
jgi:hypothetical protein